MQSCQLNACLKIEINVTDTRIADSGINAIIGAIASRNAQNILEMNVSI